MQSKNYFGDHMSTDNSARVATEEGALNAHPSKGARDWKSELLSLLPTPYVNPVSGAIIAKGRRLVVQSTVAFNVLFLWGCVFTLCEIIIHNFAAAFFSIPVTKKKKKKKKKKVLCVD
eukprot:Lankesteria_metandrocarpae@DN1312_c0_g1_i2.p1